MKCNILKDSNYKNGFMLKGLSSLKDGHESKKDIILNKNKKPSWFICQWNSKYNFIEDGQIKIDDDSFEIKDETKTLYAKNGKVIFSLDTKNEYDHPRKANEPWPHLLLEQNIDNYPIKDLKSLRIKGKFELLDFENYMPKGTQEGIHTSQFVVVLVAKNVNKESQDYNHFVWIVFSIFDCRYRKSPLYCSQDHALPNGEFIYSFSSDDYMENLLELHKPQVIDFDLYKMIPNILAIAQKHGFLTNTKFEDLALSGTNFGFEITGTFKSTISVDDYQIIAEY